MTTAVDLPDPLVHPFAPAGRRDPYPAYRWLQTHAPVHHDRFSGMWLVTGHAACAALLRDARFSAALGQRERARDDRLPVSMLTTDPPDHHRLRAPGGLLLGPAALRSVAGGLRQDVDTVLSGLAARGGEPDAIEDLGTPLATAVFGRLFGLPPAEHAVFTDLARAASVNLDPMAPPAQAARGRLAASALTHYLDAHARALNKRGDRTSPLAALAADGRLERHEMLGILSLAVIGGWQPLAETVGNGLLWLLPEGRAVRRRITGDPEFARTCADELLRLEAPIPFAARVATESVELPGGRVPAGARVLAVIAAANRDPAVFEDPDRLVPDRNPNPHLAFGAGPHFCLAAALVRQVLPTLLARLLTRFPDLRGPDLPPSFEPTLVPRRLTAFPLHLGPGDAPEPTEGP
ncbi:cytochrome P450 [Streptomyces durhamensis]|uniref:cytochrome P450 n=1 Tax=Streptomyces durhamensis TaxID=68194 RepID=UPI0004CDA6AD|nr:cytochrome P450 [Streptomyces durhamensis]